MKQISHFTQDLRPWGSEDQFTQNELSTVKILRVTAGKRCSLQRHHKRSEFWKVIEGSGTAQVGDVEHPLALGDELAIPVDTLHRLTGGPSGIAVLEISTGEFDEGDIERLEDDFGRV